MFAFLRAESPVLTGDLTLLRLPEPTDFAVWRDLRFKSRAELEPYEPIWAKNELARSAFAARVRQAKTLAENKEAFHFMIFKKMDLGAETLFLGGITLGNVRYGSANTGEIGYWLGTPFIKNGFMRDAVSAVLAYSFSTLRLHRVEAACIQSNTRSIALLRRCGFQFEGHARSYLEINGKRHDHLLYACLPSDALTLGS